MILVFPRIASLRQVSLLSVVRIWAGRSRSRRDLAYLSTEPHRCEDLGLTAAAAKREAAKPFWRA